MWGLIAGNSFFRPGWMAAREAGFPMPCRERLGGLLRYYAGMRHEIDESYFWTLRGESG